MGRDNSTFSVAVTEEMEAQAISKNKEAMTDGGIAYGDNSNRNPQEAQTEAQAGFLAEEAVCSVLEEAAIEYEHRGDEGEVDIVLTESGKSIDVKCRKSTTEYRNLIKSHRMTTTDETDIYILCVAQFHPIRENEIVAVEFVGYILNENVEELGEDLEMAGSQNLHRKTEVETEHLTPITDLLFLLG